MNQGYKQVLDELAGDRYETHSIGDWFFGKQWENELVNVPLRIDCDSKPEAAIDIADELEDRELSATICFLPSASIKIVEVLHTYPLVEVALHSDHAARGECLKDLKVDVKRFKAKGVTFHGDGVNPTINWQLYRKRKPKELGVEWHDGRIEYSNVVYSLRGLWNPPCVFASDHMLVNNAWNEAPWYPIYVLKRGENGGAVHLIFHSGFPIEQPQYTLLEKLQRRIQANVYGFKKVWIG